MDTVAIDPDRPDTALVGRAVELLAAGGLVAFPTETFYALGADPSNEAAVERIFAVKGRPEGTPILLLLASEDQASLAAAGPLTPVATRLARAFWPGPLTLVVRARQDLSARLTAGTGTIGLRVPGSALARALAAGLGRPITGTSANRSGRPPGRSAKEVLASLGGAFGDVVFEGAGSGGESMIRGDGLSAFERGFAAPAVLDLLIDGGETPGGPPSTVVDVTGASPRLIRPGAIPYERVLEVHETIP